MYFSLNDQGTLIDRWFPFSQGSVHLSLQLTYEYYPYVADIIKEVEHPAEEKVAKACF